MALRERFQSRNLLRNYRRIEIEITNILHTGLIVGIGEGHILLETIPEDNSDARKLIKIYAILLVILTLVIINQLPSIMITMYPELDPTYEPSHTMRTWIEPKNDTFTLHMDLYLVESEVGTIGSRFLGTGVRVDPSDNPEDVGFLYALPEDTSILWVEAYVYEDVRFTSRVEIGTRKTISLPGFPFDILITIWHGEQQ